MIFQKGHIDLVSLAEEHLEMVRIWRNAPHVRQYMHYREDITPEMQQQWFERVNNDKNYYYLIYIHGKPVGMMNCSDIDWEEGIIGNVGIFIADEQYLGSTYIVKATMLFSEFFFYAGIKAAYGKVLRNNKRAITYNLRFGYSLLPGQDEEELQTYIFTPIAYLQATKDIRAFLKRDNEVSLIVSEQEYAHPSTFLRRLLTSPIDREGIGEIEFKFAVTRW